MTKRILQVNAYYAKVGGAEVYMHNLIEALGREGYEVGVFAGSPETALDELKVRVVTRPDWDPFRLIRDPELSDAFRDYCARFEPDLIHVHNVGSLAADFAQTVGSIGVPVVQTVHEWGQLCPNAWCVHPDGTVCEGGPGAKCFLHGCEANYPFDGRVLTASVLRYNLIPKTFHHFLCPSQALADDLIRHNYRNVEALPLWGDAEDFDAGGSAVPERESNHILFLGRIVPEKGVEFLVRAMPHVLRKIPAAKLSIVGGGTEVERLEALARKLALGDSVVFHGKVPHDEVKNFFARATVNVLPSIWCENSPVTCYESYIAGLPMVASRIGGLPAMVVDDDTGFLANPRDPEDLAEKIVRVLSDEALHARLSDGCRRAFARFSKEKHLARIVEVYEALLASPPDSAPGGGADTALASADVLDSLHRMMMEFGKVEEWALGMQKHIHWLESKDKPSLLQQLRRKLAE